MSSVDVIIERIKVATVKSPIAVFVDPVKKTLVSCFGSTVITKARIKRNDPTFVGTFHRHMNMNQVRHYLNTTPLDV